MISRDGSNYPSYTELLIRAATEVVRVDDGSSCCCISDTGVDLRFKYKTKYGQ